MLDRRVRTDAAPSGERGPLVVARRVLAMVVVVGGLLAVAAWYKHNTCGCSGGVPYTAIALSAGVAAAVSLAVYVGLGVALRRR